MCGVDTKKIGVLAVSVFVGLSASVFAAEGKSAPAVDPQTAAFEKAVAAQRESMKKIEGMQKELKNTKQSFDATLEKDAAARKRAIDEKISAIDRLLGRKAEKVQACKPGEKTPGCIDCAANKGRCFRGFCCD